MPSMFKSSISKGSNSMIVSVLINRLTFLNGL